MGTSNSKQQLNHEEKPHNAIIAELKAGFATSKEFSETVAKSADCLKLWKKDGFFFYGFGKIVRRRMAEKVQMQFEKQKKALQPDSEPDLVRKDLKCRQLNLSLKLTPATKIEVLEELKKNKTELWKELTKHYKRNSTPEDIFDYYFNIPERQEGQSESDYMEDSFLIRQTRRNMILMGRSAEEIDGEVKRLKELWKNPKTKFVVKLVLAPCGVLSPTLKAGLSLARMLNLPSATFGNNHAALQVGPYLIGWFDDSVVHIEVISSSNAMLCLYPIENPSECFIDRPSRNEYLKASKFYKICSTIAEWNLNKSYNKLTANCQVFFDRIFPLDHYVAWETNYATKCFVKGVMDQKVSVNMPFSLWIRPKENKLGEYAQTQFNSYEEFIDWCRDNMRTSYEHLDEFAKEYYFICLSIERCYQLRLATEAGIGYNTVVPFFTANGEVNHTGLTIFNEPKTAQSSTTNEIDSKQNQTAIVQ